MRFAVGFFIIATATVASSGPPTASVGAPGALQQGQPVVSPPARGQSADPTTALRKEIKDLGAQIAVLQERAKKLEASTSRLSFQVSGLQGRNRTVSLDPASPKKYQRIDSDDGFFLISFENAESYLDGYRVSVDLGNLTSARYVGFKLDTTWGPRYDWDKFTEESYKKWESLKQTKQFSFTDTLLPGTWNKVSLILPSTTATQVGFIEVSIATDTVSFGVR